MRKLILLLLCLLTAAVRLQAQCVTFKDKNGRVLTTCEIYGMSNRTGAVVHTQETYIGSPYFTYPTWQEGTIQVDRQGRALNCQLAYNLVTNEVMCRFANDSTVKTITPEVFTINGLEFVRQRNTLLGIDYQMYSTVLHDGPTKLLLGLYNNLETTYDRDPNREYNIKGMYRTIKKYFIRKGDAAPTLINLSKKSMLDVFSDQANALAASIPNRELKSEDVTALIMRYDSLTAESKKSFAHFRKEDVFRELLHTRIQYPAWVGNQGVYGRVYAGFDVDSVGTIKNVAILSPENIGFGFAFEVKKALENLASVSPTFQGRYVLPVAFTFINPKDNAITRIPVNRLPDERMQNRILLTEVTIPFVTSKTIPSYREVWGYYK